MTTTGTPHKIDGTNAALTIRRADPADERQLIRLAGRDSRPRPTGEVLVAELDGELVAARSLTNGHAIADPFRPTAQVAELIALRAESLDTGAAAKQQRKRARRGSNNRRGIEGPIRRPVSLEQHLSAAREASP